MVFVADMLAQAFLREMVVASIKRKAGLDAISPAKEPADNETVGAEHKEVTVGEVARGGVNWNQDESQMQLQTHQTQTQARARARAQNQATLSQGTQPTDCRQTADPEPHGRSEEHVQRSEQPALAPGSQPKTSQLNWSIDTDSDDEAAITAVTAPAATTATLAALATDAAVNSPRLAEQPQQKSRRRPNRFASQERTSDHPTAASAALQDTELGPTKAASLAAAVVTREAAGETVGRQVEAVTKAVAGPALPPPPGAASDGLVGDEPKRKSRWGHGTARKSRWAMQDVTTALRARTQLKLDDATRRLKPGLIKKELRGSLRPSNLFTLSEIPCRLAGS
jgi:hypothetical protein